MAKNKKKRIKAQDPMAGKANFKADPTAPHNPANSWKPPPDHPMWREQREAIERIRARRMARGDTDNRDEILSGPRDFRKGLPIQE